MLCKSMYILERDGSHLYNQLLIPWPPLETIPSQSGELTQISQGVGGYYDALEHHM